MRRRLQAPGSRLQSVRSRVLTTATFLVIVASSCRAQADEDSDPWFGKDKALHFGASGVLAMGGYAVGTALVDSQGGALLIGAAVSITAGVTKECLDLAGLGDPSWKDLAWDGIGTVTGLAVAWSIHLLIRSVSAKPAPVPATASLSPFAVTF